LATFAQVLGGLVLLIGGGCAIASSTVLAVVNSLGYATKGQILGSWLIFFGGLGVGLFVIYLSLLSLEPLVRFSFINY